MALSQEDLQALGSFIESKIGTVVGDLRSDLEGKMAAATATVENHGAPDAANDAENGPDYYVHLANGDVITSKDSASTHMTVDGKSVQVIGHYTVGE